MPVSKVWLPALLALTALCCSSRSAPKSAAAVDPVALVRSISSQTVAIIARDSDGDTTPFCSGIWIARESILTAGHCAKMLEEDDSSPVGSMFSYIVQDEVVAQYEDPKRTHRARVVRYDAEHDLALLEALNPPAHETVRLVNVPPEPGVPLYCVGQDHGFYWTYIPGAMSGVIGELKYLEGKRGPWLQVTAPVSLGMSGSGSFDSDGRLLGTLSFISSTPNVAFYVHPDTIRAFVH